MESKEKIVLRKRVVVVQSTGSTKPDEIDIKLEVGKWAVMRQSSKGSRMNFKALFQTYKQAEASAIHLSDEFKDSNFFVVLIASNGYANR